MTFDSHYSVFKPKIMGEENTPINAEGKSYNPFGWPEKFDLPDAYVPSFFCIPGAYVEGFSYSEAALRASKIKSRGPKVLRADILGWIDDGCVRQSVILEFRTPNFVAKALAKLFRKEEPPNKVKVVYR